MPAEQLPCEPPQFLPSAAIPSHGPDPVFESVISIRATRRNHVNRRETALAPRPPRLANRKRAPVHPGRPRCAESAGASQCLAGKTAGSVEIRSTRNVRSDEAKPRMDLGLSAQCITNYGFIMYYKLRLHYIYTSQDDKAVICSNTIVDLDFPIWEGTQTGKSLFLQLP